MTPPQPIETCPRDGSQFLGECDGDWIKMLWHEGFGEFVSSWRRMELRPDLTFEDTGLSYKDHSPVVHNPSRWMPLIEEVA